MIRTDFSRVFRSWAESASCDLSAISERFAFDQAYEQHERGEIAAPSYFAALRHSLGIDISDDCFIAGWNDLYIDAMANVSDMISTAGKYFPVYGLTNSNPTHQREWSTRFAEELAALKKVFVSSELGLRKPDAVVYEAVAENIGFRPEQIMFFDDTADNIIGARAVGMRTVLVKSSRDVHAAIVSLGVALPPGTRLSNVCSLGSRRPANHCHVRHPAGISGTATVARSAMLPVKPAFPLVAPRAGLEPAAYCLSDRFGATWHLQEFRVRGAPLSVSDCPDSGLAIRSGTRRARVAAFRDRYCIDGPLSRRAYLAAQRTPASLSPAAASCRAGTTSG